MASSMLCAPARSNASLLEPLPAYSRRDPETSSVRSSAPSYVSEAPTYHSTLPSYPPLITGADSAHIRTNLQASDSRSSRTGLPPPTYAPGFHRAPSRRPLDSSGSISGASGDLSHLRFDISEWSATRSGPQARHYENVALRRTARNAQLAEQAQWNAIAAQFSAVASPSPASAPTSETMSAITWTTPTTSVDRNGTNAFESNQESRESSTIHNGQSTNPKTIPSIQSMLDPWAAPRPRPANTLHQGMPTVQEENGGQQIESGNVIASDTRSLTRSPDKSIIASENAISASQRTMSTPTGASECPSREIPSGNISSTTVSSEPSLTPNPSSVPSPEPFVTLSSSTSSHPTLSNATPSCSTPSNSTPSSSTPSSSTPSSSAPSNAIPSSSTSPSAAAESIPFSPLEDPDLVGIEGARVATARRLCRMRIADDRDALALKQEQASWDFLLCQMADWQERERAWERFRREACAVKGLGRLWRR